MRNLHTTILVIALVAIASIITTIKIRDLGLPLIPGQMEPVWSLEAKISFDALKRGAIVDFDIPDKLGNYVVLEEYFVARNYGVFTFVSQLLVKLNNSSADSNVELIKESIRPSSEAWVDRAIYVLAGARITARMIRGIVLEDGASQSILVPWLEVHNGEHWEGFNPATGSKGYPEGFVRWAVGSEPVLSVENGQQAHVSFAI